jgi:hypothetical protein
MSNYLSLSVRTIVYFFALSTPAYAYIDPGSGFLMLQGLFALIGGILVSFKKPWQMLKRFFLRKTDKDA